MSPTDEHGVTPQGGFTPSETDPPTIQHEPAKERSPSSRAKSLFGLVAFLALAFALFAHTWAHPTTVTIGGGQDRAYFMWFLRWMQYAVFHGHNIFFSTHLNYPTGINMMWNGSEIVPGIVLSPLTAAFGAAVTFNLLMTLAPALTAWCATILFKQGVQRWSSAWLGGLLFGFSPFIMIQSLGHLHTTLAFLMPLILLVVYEIVVRQRMRAPAAGAILGVLVGVQLLTGEEILAITAMMVGIVLVYLMIAFRGEIVRRAPHVLRAGVVAFGTFMVIGAYPLWVQFFGGARVHGAIQPVNKYASDLLGFVLPTRFQWFAPAWATARSQHFTGGQTEHLAYLGLPLILLLLWIIVRAWSKPAVRAVAVSGTVMAVLSLGTHLNINGHRYGLSMPWRFFAKIPVLQDILASRLILGVFLAAGFLLAVAVDRIADGSWGRRALGAGLVALIVLTLFPALPFPSTPVQRSQFFASPEADVIPNGAVVLMLPVGYGPKAGNEPMLWHEQAQDRFARFGGYFFGPTPAGPADTLVRRMFSVEAAIQEDGSVPAPDAAERGEIIRLLHETRARFVVVGPIAYQAELTAYMTSVLGKAPERRLDADLWRL